MTLVLAGAEPVAGTGTGAGSKLDRLDNTGPDEDVQARWRFISLIIVRIPVPNIKCGRIPDIHTVWPNIRCGKILDNGADFLFFIFLFICNIRFWRENTSQQLHFPLSFVLRSKNSKSAFKSSWKFLALV